MSQRHAVPARGLDLLDVTKPSEQADTVNFGARFGRMFADLRAATFGKTEGEVFKNLELLAAKMVASFDAPKDEPDDAESGIPSLYTCRVAARNAKITCFLCKNWPQKTSPPFVHMFAIDQMV